MEFCSVRKERVGNCTNGDPSFYDQVLSWSIADIFDENLFKDKVKQIPVAFQSIFEYFNAFVFPLLEEVRAELCFSLEMISRAPFAALVSCYLSRHHTRRRLFDIKVDYWRNGVSGNSHGLSGISSGDVVILVKSKPQTAYDLQLIGENCVLGHVVNVLEDDPGGCTTSTSFRVRAPPEGGLTNHGNSFYFVCFLVNLTKYERMWNKLHMRSNLKIINKVLNRYPMSEDGECYCLKTKDDGLDAKFEASFSRLNQCQRKVIIAFLRDMQCDHVASITRVSGPPGTGKTVTISTLLCILLERNCRTVMCAATKVAITVVLRHVLALLKESREQGVNERLSLASIVLVDNEKPFGAAFECENVSLDFRVKQLAECFHPESGWRACFSSLLDFLKKCRSQYKDLVKKGARSMSYGDQNAVHSPLQYGPFVSFARDKFMATALRVKRYVSVFCTHLPQSFLLKQNIYRMQLLTTQLDSFESVLLQDNLKFEQLQSQAKSIKSLLRLLRDSLGELPFPDVTKADSIIEFCLRLPTLVVCEAHCSFRLYTAEMQPVNVLVIDEGSQLTECESVVALQLPGLKHAILFGDENQLPATLKSKLSSISGYGRSMFQRLGLLNWPKHVLNIQYRMHPAISSFPNSKFYLNQIMDAPNVRSRGWEKQYLPGKLFGPYSFINICQSKEEVDDDGQLRNLVEVAVLMKILQNLYREWRCSSQKLSVSVMSPYPAQVIEIERRLAQRYQNSSDFAVQVKTIEGFQGSEADVVIILTVRSNVAGSMQSISDFRRVNVALTRARHCLWVLGNEHALARADPVWKALISNAKERKCLLNADEDLNIAQVIINVKTDLDQLVDLLNKDSFIFEHTRWKVIFSERFVKSFSKLPSTWSKKVALNFLVRLANGWRPKKYKSEPSCQSSLRIARQYKVVGYYIICTNDIVMETACATQVLKVWDILHLEDVPELVKKLDDIYGAYTDDFLIRCREKCLEGMLEVPRRYRPFNISRYKCAKQKFANIVDAEDADICGTSCAENSKVKDSLLLMKFYSLSGGFVNHLLASSDGRALDLPFEVTDEQREVILHQNTTFVLGRSGTGKTTVLAMKLFQKEQLNYMASEGLCPVSDASRSSSICKEGCASGNIHQLFVTVNPRLCFAVKQHVSNLRRFVCGEFTEGWSQAGLNYVDEIEEFKDIPNSFHDIPANSFPLIMTFRIFLLMLDSTVGASFFHRYRAIKDIYSMDTSSPRVLSLQNFVMRKEVTYDRFRTSYWPHFDSRLTRHLDSSRVFTEINSCIKGGRRDDHKIPRKRYIQASHKRVSNFCEKEREAIYDIFERYEKMKMVREEFDLADLVNDLHRRLKVEGYEGKSMDFVYIDEVQDLTMKQIALFKYICKNVEDGFSFAGDTAQTIARGVDFRFQDIRRLFYREFLHGAETNGKHRVQVKGKISPLFKLRQNFRTHLGVLNLAQSVVDLIYHFFPSSIDPLSRESSLVDGEAPILLDCGSKADAIIKIFENSGYSSENAINFGSEQVILVRDDCARNEISDHFRGHALVLTIFECKGLEFQDVLLYNFFGSSSLNNEWRVIYEYMEKKTVGSSSPVSSPSFDRGRYNVLCFELKQLYVAITRARQRLWICERDGLSSPMFDYWRELNVVQVREFGYSFAKEMQVSCTLENWRERGLKMLQVHNYRAAEMCFERANDYHWKIFARAAGLKVSAQNMRSWSLGKSVKLFREAAELFESINNTKEAAQCYFGAEEYEKAGNLFYRESDLQRAAQCFNFSGCYGRAAQVYAEGGYFYECSEDMQGKLFF